MYFQGMDWWRGKALCEHPRIARLDLTGGTETGRVVASIAGRRLIPVCAELGGKAPVLVFEDTDLITAVNGIAFASFVASGQTCVSATRILVHESIYDEFVKALVTKANTIKLGLPMDPSTQMGPVISDAQLTRVAKMVETSISQGAQVLCGGGRVTYGGLENGYFYAPTILGNVGEENIAFKEEIFGPVIVVKSFSTEAQAISLANNCKYGLGSSVWTQDIKRAHNIAQRLQSGLVWINDHHRNDPSSPWGGMKDSGMGRENGWEAYRAYTQTQSVVVNLDRSSFDWYAQTTNVRYG